MDETVHSPRQRVESFCRRLGLRVPILLAPMSGASAPSLSIAIGQAGGLGACGALTMSPAQILEWAGSVRAAGVNAFQINTWIPGPVPHSDPQHEAQIRAFLGQWRAAGQADAALPDFEAQCEAMAAARPLVVSSIMGCTGARRRESVSARLALPRLRCAA